MKKYDTIGTVPKSNRKIRQYRNSSEIQQKNTTVSEQFRNPIEKLQKKLIKKKQKRTIVERGKSDTETRLRMLNDIIFNIYTVNLQTETKYVYI